MNKLICPPTISIEIVAYKWVKKQIEIQKLKSKIAECVKANHADDAKKYVAEMKKLEDTPLVTYPNPCVCY